MRADKLTLGALQHLALTYLSGDACSIPLWRAATTPVEVLESRAASIASAISNASAVATEAVAGGGSLPGRVIPSAGVRVGVQNVDDALAALRASGIVARSEDDGVLCDLRTVDAADDGRLAAALAELR
jgi:hypothetical protein